MCFLCFSKQKTIGNQTRSSYFSCSPCFLEQCTIFKNKNQTHSLFLFLTGGNSQLYADEVALFWGITYYNNELLQADDKKLGSLTTDILLDKDSKTFTLSNGWAFPRRIYFNGENCEMPLPDTYPMLPNGSLSQKLTHSQFFLILLCLTVKVLATWL